MNLSGSPFDYLIAFASGILLSFTPCVYPLIPVSASFIGISSEGKRLRGFLLGLAYVTGFAIIYAILGLLTSLAGVFFGKFTMLPATHFLVGSVIIFFGFSMLGVFNLSLPSFIKPPEFQKKGFLSAFVLGLCSGLMVSPCLTPVLGSILAYLATKQNIFYGTTLLLTFAYGMGFVLLLAGLFSSAIFSVLPKSGKWLTYIKNAFAIILILSGLYFIYNGITRLPIPKCCAAAELEPAPDFSLQDLNKKTFTLSDYKGKQPVILFFWTTGCPYCRDELKMLNDTHLKMAKDGFEVLAVDIGEASFRVENFAERRLLTFRILLDQTGDVATAYGLFGVPTYVLIDKDGNIVYKGNGFPIKEYNKLLIRHKNEKQ